MGFNSDKIELAPSHLTSPSRSELLLFLIFFLIIFLLLLVITIAVIFVLFFCFLLLLRNFDLLDWSIRVNTQFLGHQPVNSAYKSRWIRNLIPGFDKSSLEEDLCSIQGSRVLFVSLDF